MKKLFLSVLTLGLVLVACNESEAKKETAPAAQPQPAVQAPAAKPAPAEKQVVEPKTIEWDKALEMANAGALLIDVRSPDELMHGYVPNAKNVPLNLLSQKLDELPKDKDILVYCRSGRRSEVATVFMMKSGFDRVYNVAGGYLAYSQLQK